ncbi:MAG: hypothetical protein M3254_08085 [Actinomycetota bacterium]|nr:hypothetical protein [Actinomycetota bacterium]
MKRLLLLAALAFVASLFLAPAVVAQDLPEVPEEFLEEVTETPEEPLPEQLQEAELEAKLEEKAGVPEPAEVEDQKLLPPDVKQKAAPPAEQKGGEAKQKQMPKTGGIELSSMLLPVTVLLAGSGLLVAYSVRQRRR